MFRKPPTLANSTQLKSSERRNLQKHVAECYDVSIDEAKVLLPESLKQCKATTSAGEHLTLYSDTDGPVAFRLGKGEQGPLVPTLYTIWSSSNNLSLPILVTNDMVLEKLAGGADLFAAGISAKSLDDLPEGLVEGSLVGIGTSSISGAIRAVGRLPCPAANLRRSREGKAAEVLHVEGDMLWDLGKKSRAEAKSAGLPVQSEAKDEVTEIPSDSVAQAGSDQPPETGTSLSQADVDLILHEALLYAISQILAKQPGVFPLSSSKFMDTYIFPSRWASSAEHEVSIKKSSFKNASSFLKQAKKDGLISTKEAKGGDVSIISVSPTHPEVKAFRPYKTVAQLQKQEKKKEVRDEQQASKSMQRSIDVSQLYKPHGATLTFCSELGFSKDSLALATDIRTAANDYITAQSLINPHEPSYINLNESLSTALLKKGEKLDFLPRSEILDRMLKNMQAWHRILLKEGGKEEEIVQKGAASKVSIAVKKRQGKKLVTIIEGLETYMIPHQKLAEDLQVKCACSSTTNELPGSSAKKPLHEVVVQGSQIPIVTKELVDVWGVPKNWLDVTKCSGRAELACLARWIRSPILGSGLVAPGRMLVRTSSRSFPL